MLWTKLARVLRYLALAVMAVAAVFGIPIIIDPPPRDKIVQTDDATGKGGRRKARGRRRS